MEENEFDGESNDLVYARVHKLAFECEFDLYWYPFDLQTCSIRVRKISDGPTTILIEKRNTKSQEFNFLINSLWTKDKLLGD